MNLAAPSKWTFLVAGFYALACAPAILVVEHFGWPQAPFHLTQFFAVVVCFPSSLVFLWSTRGSAFGAIRCLAMVAVLLCGLWLAFFAWLMLTLDFSGM